MTYGNLERNVLEIYLLRKKKKKTMKNIRKLKKSGNMKIK